LPAYMVPTQINFLDELPQTARGKLDIRALPEQPRQPKRAPSLYGGPMAKLEREVAEVFADVLGVARVGVDDDFFALGGNSLLIARVGTRLCKAFGVDLPLHSLFTQPTVGGVTKAIELFQRSGSEGILSARDPAMLITEARLDPAITPEHLPV